jgi:integrase
MSKEIIPAWRGRRLSEISKSDIYELLDSIADRGAPILANRVLAWLKGLCNWAVGRGLINASPCTSIKSPAAETARDRVLSDAELRAVWQASDALGWPYCGFVQLLILTGQRRNEVADLTWREIDLEAKTWTLPAVRAKNGVEHQIPLSDLAVEILRAGARLDGCDYVFSMNGRNPIRGYHLVKNRLDAMSPGGAPWVLHDARRTVATGLARLGVQMPVVEKLLNHVSGSFSGVAGIYQRHDFANEKRAAMQTWANFVQALVTGEVSNIVPMTRRAGEAAN